MQCICNLCGTICIYSSCAFLTHLRPGRTEELYNPHSFKVDTQDYGQQVSVQPNMKYDNNLIFCSSVMVLNKSQKSFFCRELWPHSGDDLWLFGKCQHFIRLDICEIWSEVVLWSHGDLWPKNLSPSDRNTLKEFHQICLRYRIRENGTIGQTNNQPGVEA